MFLQLAYRRQQILKRNEFLTDGRDPIPVENAQEVAFQVNFLQDFGFYSIQMIGDSMFYQHPEKTNEHSDALKGYILGVTDSSYEKYLSEYFNNRKRINNDKLYAMNEIDDNIRDAIIQHYDNDFDLELAEIIIELFDVRFEKDFLKCDIAISDEPVHSMEIWKHRLCAMLEKFKWHIITAILTKRKVLKTETDCEQQQWLISCANEPTTMVKQ